ncbi:MAG: ECF transporter S component [Lachnospiraceae bacterium]|nr:ECF transporter S component [Lachnospiraceae bacterium]
MNTSVKTRNLVLTAAIAAIIVMMAFVPYVGYINLVVIKATLIHVPVIIGSVVLGPKKGAFLGFIFGFTSLINNTFNPSLLSFAFSPFYSGGNLWSLVICFVPRILVGVVPYFVYRGVMKLGNGHKAAEFAALPLAGVTGALVNTILVMNLIYFCFAAQYAAVKEIAVELVYDGILAIIVANGVPEAIVAAVLTLALGKVLLHLRG